MASEKGGLFTVESRKAAIAATLPLLDTYFSKGNGWYSPTDGLEAADQETTHFLTGLRLRIHTAAATRILDALAGVHARPTFRYRPTSEDGEDLSRGALDLARLSTDSPSLESPRRYPLLVTTRTTNTPENALTLLCVQVTRKRLLDLLDMRHQTSRMPVISRSSQDRVQASSLLARLERAETLPALVPGRTAVATCRTHHQVQALLDKVRRRIHRREIPPSSVHYQEIVDVGEMLFNTELAPAAGEVPWDFYDPTFDSKLFEIWFLHTLATWLNSHLRHEAVTPDLKRRSLEPVYSWNLPFGSISVHFQRSPTVIDRSVQPIWRPADTGHPVTGIPDVTVLIRIPNQPDRWIFIDPKLRQRRAAPTEELFKILGYFNNYGFGEAGRGGVVYYAPRDKPARTREWKTPQGGRLLSIPMDPANAEESAHAIGTLGGLLLEECGVTPLSPHLLEASDGETTAQIRQSQAESYLLQTGAQLGDQLNPYLRLGEQALGAERWAWLSPDTRTIIATGVYVAATLDRSLDYSGPILGICAAVERSIKETVVASAVASAPTERLREKIKKETKTVGAMLYRFDRLDQRDDISVQLAAAVRSRGIDRANLDRLLPRLKRLNEDFRVPAAHVEVLTESDWHALHDIALVSDDGRPLLRDLIDVLYPRRD